MGEATYDEKQIFYLTSTQTSSESVTTAAQTQTESETEKPLAQAKTYYATTNLRLRREPDTSKDNIIDRVNKDDGVRFLEIGETETIDGITAPWFKVQVLDGPTGWLFSGYLAESKTTQTPTETDQSKYIKILNGDLSDFAGIWVNGNGERKELKPDGNFGDSVDAYVFQRHKDGYYSWNVEYEIGGSGVHLYPVGVEIYGDIPTGEYTSEYGIFQTDATKVRITIVMHDALGDANKIYYME
jgi:hypothetical protein